MKRLAMGCLMAGLLLAWGSVAQAAAKKAASDEGGWKLELTPYAWLAGIDGDVTVRGQTVHVDQKFKDLVEHVDGGAELMAIAEYNRWIMFLQGDWLSLAESGSAPNGINGDIGMDQYFLTAAGGYQFDGFIEGSKIAVLGGVRYVHLDSQVTVSGFGTKSATANVTDGIVMFRPDVPLSKKWRFNPTMDIGAGDSDLTWELQPQVQYDFTKNVAGRFGYRRVHYNVDKNNNGFDGSFSGFILGLGVKL